jgi:two-component system, OmpR family, phosphate regulon response regulator PhoB
MSEIARKHVLIVEDDDSIATALEYVLTRAGLGYDRIADGNTAVNRIRDIRPDLVLLDVMLPGVSGYDICSTVRSDRSLDAVRILMMTARGTAKERARGMALGADAFVQKPFDLKTLRDTISSLLVSQDQPGA